MIISATKSVKKDSFFLNTFFDKQDKTAILEAIKWSKAREGNFKNDDILSDIASKFSAYEDLTQINNFNEVELSQILDTIEDNLNYISKYSYPTSAEFALLRKTELSNPLINLKNKIKGDSSN